MFNNNLRYNYQCYC